MFHQIVCQYSPTQLMPESYNMQILHLEEGVDRRIDKEFRMIGRQAQSIFHSPEFRLEKLYSTEGPSCAMRS